MDAFISYSRKDKQFVQRLHDTLIGSGRNVWVDWEDIPLTADWWAEIQEGIEGANAVIFVISPDSVASKVCGQELEHAIQHNKRLIPLVYRDCNDAPHSISHINWLYFRDNDDFDAAAKNLLAVMDTDLEWAKAHTRLTQRAVEWDKQERNNSYLLYGDDLANAEGLLTLTNKTPALTQLQRDYILASQQKQAADLLRDLEQAKALAETEKRRREEEQRYTAQLRRRSMIIIGALALVSVVGVAAIMFALRSGRLTMGTNELVDTIVEFGDSQANSDLCWAGALRELPGEVLPACNKAIELDPEVPEFFESRGLTWAVMGEYPSAISDFNSAIKYARQYQESEDRIPMWQDWIAQLEQGQNPFHKEVMQQLREDWDAEKAYFNSPESQSN